jgi:WD40 repeat protein
LSFSPSSALLASGGDDESVCLWDLSSRALLRCLTGPEAMISCVAFSSDSQLLVAGSSGGELWFWHSQGVRLGEQAAVIQAAHDLGVLGLDFAPTDRSPLLPSAAGLSPAMLLATCGNDDLVRLWIVSSNSLIDTRIQVQKYRELRGHTSNVNCCRFSSDGRLIASA